MSRHSQSVSAGRRSTYTKTHLDKTIASDLVDLPLLAILLLKRLGGVASLGLVRMHLAVVQLLDLPTSSYVSTARLAMWRGKDDGG